MQRTLTTILYNYIEQLYYTIFRVTHLQRGFAGKVPPRGTRFISPLLKQGVLRRESIIQDNSSILTKLRAERDFSIFATHQ